MSASLKQSTPATLAVLEAALTNAENRRAQAQRANSTARTARPLILMQGDSDAIQANRREIDATATRLAECSEEVEFAEAALQAARDLARSDVNRVRFERIEKALAMLVKEADACEDTGSDLTKVLERRHRVTEELIQAHVAKYIDPHIFNDPEILNTHQLALWLRSDGVLGRGPGLDTPTQLRASGHASLSLKATQYRGYILQTARPALGVT